MMRGTGRTVAVSVTYLLVFLIFFLPFYFFVPPLLDESVGFISAISQYIDTFNLASFVSPDLIASTKNVINSQSLTNTVLGFRQFFSTASGGFLHLISTVFGGIFSFFLIVVLSVYFALNETGIDDFLTLIVPALYREYALSLWHRSQAKIGLWMQGQIILSLLMGVLGYLWLAILQVPYAFLIAIFAMVIEIVPVFGSIISGTIATAIAFSAGGPTLGLLVAGGFIVINQLQSHLVYPLVVKQVVGVPPLLVILALIAGGQLAGFYGVLLSVPAAAALKEFVSDIQKQKEKELARTK
jgi:predicted PurR-regulated permease PerM